MAPLRVALAQIAPRLGALDENLVRHHELIDSAREQGADLVVFPELGLTGYLLQDLNAEVAMQTSLKEPALSAASQAGMVNNLNDGLAWGLFPVLFAAAGLSVDKIGILAALYPAVWGLANSSPVASRTAWAASG